MIDINKIFDMFGGEEPEERYPEPSEDEVRGILGFDEFRTTPT